VPTYNWMAVGRLDKDKSSMNMKNLYIFLAFCSVPAFGQVWWNTNTSGTMGPLPVTTYSNTAPNSAVVYYPSIIRFQTNVYLADSDIPMHMRFPAFDGNNMFVGTNQFGRPITIYNPEYTNENIQITPDSIDSSFGHGIEFDSGTIYGDWNFSGSVDVGTNLVAVDTDARLGVSSNADAIAVLMTGKLDVDSTSYMRTNPVGDFQFRGSLNIDSQPIYCTITSFTNAAGDDISVPNGVSYVGSYAYASYAGGTNFFQGDDGPTLAVAADGKKYMSDSEAQNVYTATNGTTWKNGAGAVVYPAISYATNYSPGVIRGSGVELTGVQKTADMGQYVPYTGASADINVGSSFKVLAGQVGVGNNPGNYIGTNTAAPIGIELSNRVVSIVRSNGTIAIGHNLRGLNGRAEMWMSGYQLYPPSVGGADIYFGYGAIPVNSNIAWSLSSRALVEGSHDGGRRLSIFQGPYHDQAINTTYQRLAIMPFGGILLSSGYPVSTNNATADPVSNSTVTIRDIGTASLYLQANTNVATTNTAEIYMCAGTNSCRITFNATSQVPSINGLPLAGDYTTPAAAGAIATNVAVTGRFVPYIVTPNYGGTNTLSPTNGLAQTMMATGAVTIALENSTTNVSDAICLELYNASSVAFVTNNLSLGSVIGSFTTNATQSILFCSPMWTTNWSARK